ncbi:MAG: thioredoxin domain-containing protein, partial [Candidatus Baltobacteraceae bacterium]
MSDGFRFSPRPNRAAEIPWHAWGAEAFALARSSDRPILLSLSAVWCHWCHVMDETSYSDPEVIATIARDFVPIRVDNDERPDINARYNMGGWPTTAFLAPDGSILTGATYLPPPAMRQTLARIAHYYAEHRDKIEELMRDASHRSEDPEGAAEIDASAPDFAFEQARTSYDGRNGGFGDAPKFPQCDLLEFLLDDGLAGRHESLAMLIRTLRAMAGGGTYDRIEGGFFRYSTTADWSVPHFEKMAEDHGALLRILARLLAYENDPALQRALHQSTAYVRATLYDEERGVFLGSQDADERYFALGALERAGCEKPYVDPTSYTAWSAALAGAFAQIAVVTGDDELAAIARRALDTLEDRMCGSDGLMLRVWRRDEEPRVHGILADQCATIAASLDAYEALGDERFFQRADRLAHATLAAFAPGGGAAADRIASAEDLGRLTLRDRPLTENASLARSLLRIAELADRPEDAER